MLYRTKLFCMKIKQEIVLKLNFNQNFNNKNGALTIKVNLIKSNLKFSLFLDMVRYKV